MGKDVQTKEGKAKYQSELKLIDARGGIWVSAQLHEQAKV